MSQQKFDDECPDCLPILIEIVYQVWAGTTKEEREAFHQVTCLNSRVPSVLALFYKVTKSIEDALKAQPK